MFIWEEAGHSLQRALRRLGAQSFALPLTQHAEYADPTHEDTLPDVPREAAEPLLYKVRLPEMGLFEGGENHKRGKGVTSAFSRQFQCGNKVLDTPLTIGMCLFFFRNFSTFTLARLVGFRD